MSPADFESAVRAAGPIERTVTVYPGAPPRTDERGWVVGTLVAPQSTSELLLEVLGALVDDLVGAGHWPGAPMSPDARFDAGGHEGARFAWSVGEIMLTGMDGRTRTWDLLVDGVHVHVELGLDYGSFGLVFVLRGSDEATMIRVETALAGALAARGQRVADLGSQCP